MADDPSSAVMVTPSTPPGWWFALFHETMMIVSDNQMHRTNVEGCHLNILNRTCFTCRPSQRLHCRLDLQPGHQVLLHLRAEGHRLPRLHPAGRSDHPHCQRDVAGRDGHHGSRPQQPLLTCGWACVYRWRTPVYIIMIFEPYVNRSIN